MSLPAVVKALGLITGFWKRLVAKSMPARRLEAASAGSSSSSWSINSAIISERELALLSTTLMVAKAGFWRRLKETVVASLKSLCSDS